jgi:hypothetical protein
MNPSLYFVLLLAVTTGAAIWQYRLRRSLSRHLRRLAMEWEMNYSQGDPLQLTQRIACVFAVVGAAHVTITDLIYGIEDDHYRYYLATEFTVGLTRSKKRMRRVVTFTEPRTGNPRMFSPMRVAPAELSILEQFEHLGPQPDGHPTLESDSQTQQ